MRSAFSLGVLAIFVNLSSPPVSFSQTWAPASGLSDSQACGSSPNLYDYSPQGQPTRAYFRESDAYRRCVDANRRESIRTLREQREAENSRRRDAEVERASKKESEARKYESSGQPTQLAATNFDTAIFTAKNKYCSTVAASGGVVVDKPLLIDRAVVYAISIWKEDVTDRDVFRSRVVQAIESEGCGRTAYSPPPSQSPSLPSAVPSPTPQYGGSCVAIINGVRLKMCSGRF
jgi:hypothetical protein